MEYIESDIKQTQIFYETDDFLLRRPHSLQEYEALLPVLVPVQLEDPLPALFQVPVDTHLELAQLTKAVLWEHFVFLEDKHAKEVAGGCFVMGLDHPAKFDPSTDPVYEYLVQLPKGVSMRAMEAYPQHFDMSKVKHGLLRRVFIFHKYRGKGLLTYIYQGVEQVARNLGLESIHIVCSAP